MLSEEALAQIKQDGYTAEALAPYREASVLGLVRQLAEAMTSDDANARTAAVGFLWRACLTGDAKHYQRRADFDAAAVDAVVKFLAEKALTYATADEAYEGLAAIVSKYLPLMQPATVEFLCTEWLPAAGLQRQGVKSRQRGLAVLKALASTHGRTMGAGGDLVARGLLAAVDEERDPSNVMAAFTVNALLVAAFQRADDAGGRRGPLRQHSRLLPDPVHTAAGLPRHQGRPARGAAHGPRLARLRGVRADVPMQ
jgi:hypothetical protein